MISQKQEGASYLGFLQLTPTKSENTQRNESKTMRPHYSHLYTLDNSFAETITSVFGPNVFRLIEPKTTFAAIFSLLITTTTSIVAATPNCSIEQWGNPLDQ